MRIAFLLVLSSIGAASAADREGTHDHPAVKRWPGAVIAESDSRPLETFKFPVKDGQTKMVTGKYQAIVYQMPSAITCAQITRKMEEGFKAQEFATHRGAASPSEDTDWTDGKWVSAEGRGKANGQLFILAACPTDNFEGPELFVWVIENQKMQPSIEPDAEAIANELTKRGRVALYGINFAAGKAEPTGDSSRQLEVVAAMLKSKADWTVRIESHSDNAAGSSKASVALATRRANAVKKWLTGKLGVEPAQLVAEGMGDKTPLSSNSTEEGRANNRRIELVRP